MAKGGFDKEALKKHQFWIVLGAFALLWIVAFVTVKLAASDAKKQAYDKAKKGIEDAWKQGPKTEAYQKPWKEHGDLFRTHKDVIWGQAWDRQKDMYTWPPSMPEAARPKYYDDLFGPPGNTTVDLQNRSAFRTEWYQELWDGLDNYVAPAEFAGGTVLSVIPQQTWDRSTPPSREEIWLAMEDYWVKREMLQMVHDAMAAVAYFKEVNAPKDDKELAQRAKEDKEKLAKGEPLKRVFRNANWELTLLLEPRKPGERVLVISDKSTIKNVNAAGRTMFLAHPKTNRGLPFRAVQGTASSEFGIASEPLAYGNQVQLKQKIATGPVDLSRPFGVEQLLTWEISPVRRVESLELGYHSHRTITAGLKVNEELKKLDPDLETPAAGGTGETAGPGSSESGATTKKAMTAMGGGGGMMAGGGAASAGDVTPINGIQRERYMYITPQCRHLPIALKLLIDQAHIHDVLTAIANSRLRIQVTQVTMHHDPSSGSLQQGGLGSTGEPGGAGPSLGSGGGPAAGGGGIAKMGGNRRREPPTMGGPPTPGGRSGPGGMYGMMGSPRPGGGMMGGLMGLPGRPFMPGGGGLSTGEGGPGPGMPGLGGAGATEGVSTFQDTAKLIEVSIYGVASLYERFPPRPKQDAGSGGATPGATPPATTSTPTK